MENTQVLKTTLFLERRTWWNSLFRTFPHRTVEWLFSGNFTDEFYDHFYVKTTR